MHIETRNRLETVRVESRNGGKVLIGYAAVFFNPVDPGTEFELWGGCVERIDPRAFDRALRERQDVICDFNHNRSMLLGRTSSGTCRLSVDRIGLRYETDLTATGPAARVAVLVGRGDVTGSSFAFHETDSKWSTDSRGIRIRLITDCDLIDVGPVTRPAYKSTTADMRSQQEQDRYDVAAVVAQLRADDRREVDVVRKLLRG